MQYFLTFLNCQTLEKLEAYCWLLIEYKAWFIYPRQLVNNLWFRNL